MGAKTIDDKEKYNLKAKKKKTLTYGLEASKARSSPTHSVHIT